jgi:hypothetical protein
LLNFGFDRGNLGRAERPANLHSAAIAEHQIDAGACGSNNSATGDHHQNDDLHAAADEVSGDLALAWYSLAQFSPSLPNLTRLAPPTEVQHLHAEATV